VLILICKLRFLEMSTLDPACRIVLAHSKFFPNNTKTGLNFSGMQSGPAKSLYPTELRNFQGNTFTLQKRTTVLPIDNFSLKIESQKVLDRQEPILREQIEIDRLRLADPKSQIPYIEKKIGVAINKLAVKVAKYQYELFKTIENSMQFYYDQYCKLLINNAEKDVQNAELELQLANANDLASKDPLTGILNKGAFNERLNEFWELNRRAGTPFTLIILDIDYFKLFNDTYGHAEGDKCLKSVVEALEKSIRPHDVIGRVGGEEFAILLTNTTIGEGLIVAQRAKEKVQGVEIPHQKSSVSDFVTISLGLESFIPDSTQNSPTELYEAADKALYKSKEHRNCCSTLEKTFSTNETDAYYPPTVRQKRRRLHELTIRMMKRIALF
jgi:diguanylate cyclase (GGDEF)-like protein